jgi:hypothetical protein
VLADAEASLTDLLPLCQSIVGEVLRAKVEMDRHMQHLGLPLLPFPKVVYLFFLRTYGTVVLLWVTVAASRVHV